MNTLNAQRAVIPCGLSHLPVLQRGLIAMVLLGVFGLSAQNSYAVYAYECGNPTLTANGDELITSSDALRILRSAVGQPVTCLDCVCDVNSSGKVLSSDALLTLRKAVGQPVTLDCPDNNYECTECTTAALKDKLENGLSGPLMGQETWVIFRCADNSIIEIDQLTWPDTGVSITATGAVIDGSLPNESRNITIGPSAECGCASTADTFLNFDADDVTLRGMTIKNFRQGVLFRASDGTVGGDDTGQEVTFSKICQQAIRNVEGAGNGIGSEVRNTTVVGKCSLNNCTADNKGPDISEGLACTYPTGAYSRDCYHISYHDVDFVDCSRAVVATGLAGNDAKILVSQGSMAGTTATSCIGSILSAARVTARFEGWISSNCDTALEVSGTGTVIDVVSSHIDSAESRGIRVKGGAAANVNCTTVTDTDNSDGSACTGTTECGGIVHASGQTRLGTGSTGDPYVGKNHIANNFMGTAARDIRVAQTSYTLTAEQAWWGANSDPDSSRFSLVTGASVDWNPRLDKAPSFMPLTCAD